MQRLGPSWVMEDFLGTAAGNTGPELFFEQYERWIGAIETRNRETSNEAVSLGLDRFENLLVRESVKFCD